MIISHIAWTQIILIISYNGKIWQSIKFDELTLDTARVKLNPVLIWSS